MIRFFLTLICCAGLHATEKTCIRFIVTDDLGHRDMRTYNVGSEMLAPHLDRLAIKGMRATDADAAFPVCSPSRSAILTGRYVHSFDPGYEHYLGGTRS